MIRQITNEHDFKQDAVLYKACWNRQFSNSFAKFPIKIYNFWLISIVSINCREIIQQIALTVRISIYIDIDLEIAGVLQLENLIFAEYVLYKHRSQFYRTLNLKHAIYICKQESTYFTD